MKYLVAAFVIVVMLGGCATPPVVVAPTPTPAPVTQVCNICRWVDAQGIILFTKCGLPHDTVVAGWSRSKLGSCSYDQLPHSDPLPVPQTMPMESL